MVERTPEPRDLVAELRRVDEAFAQLKPSRRDDLERLIDGDTDELVRQSNRVLTRTRLRTAFAMGGSALAVVALLAVATTTTTTTTTPMGSVAVTAPAAAPAAAPALAAAVLPMATPASTTTASTPTVAAVAAATSTSPIVSTPRLQRLQGLAPSRERGTLSPSSFSALAPMAAGTGDRLDATNGGSIDGAVVGVAGTASDGVIDRVADDDVQEALLEARSLSQRGAPADAARVLAALLARGPSPRVVDVVSSEQASLLARAGQVAGACALWSAHRQRFPSSDNAAAVTAALVRWQCP